MTPLAPAGARITASIVSHGHGTEVERLLADLARLAPPAPDRVILTLNRPEPQLAAALRARDWPFQLLLIENTTPAGFGTNHNRAFACDQERGAAPWFAVLNPDLRLRANPFGPLLDALRADPHAGAAYPVQRDAAGRQQDHERLLPSPARLLRRHLLRRREVEPGQTPDWVNGAFLLLRRGAYAQLQGFDERYRMYCEDVDLCLRLQLAGWHLVRVDTASVEHTGHRGSRRRPRHLAWHLASLWRLWRSPAWSDYRRRGRGP